MGGHPLHAVNVALPPALCDGNHMHAALSLDLMLSTVQKQGGASALHALVSCAQLCFCSIWSKLPCSCWSLGGQLHSHALLSCAQLDAWTSLPCLAAVQAPSGVRLAAQPPIAVMQSVILAQHLHSTQHACRPECCPCWWHRTRPPPCTFCLTCLDV